MINVQWIEFPLAISGMFFWLGILGVAIRASRKK
jgi:hypothetical protein